MDFVFVVGETSRFMLASEKKTTREEWSFCRWRQYQLNDFLTFWCVCQQSTTITTLYHREKCQTAHAFKIPGNPRVNTYNTGTSWGILTWEVGVMLYIHWPCTSRGRQFLNCRPGSKRRVHSGTCIFTAYIYYYYKGEHPPRHVTWAIKWRFCCYIQILKIIWQTNKFNRVVGEKLDPCLLEEK